MFRVAIVEDDLGQAEVLQSYLKTFSESENRHFSIATFNEPYSFLESYNDHFDLLLLDIDLPHINGMEIARQIRAKDHMVLIMFITKMAQYAIEGYEVEAFDFMVKPVDYHEFSFKLKRSLKMIEAQQYQTLTVMSPSGIKCFDISKIAYVEVSGHQIYYHCLHEVIQARGTLKACENELKPYGFMKCNRCYLLNPKYIKAISGHRVQILGADLQISHPKRKTFIKAYEEWMTTGGSKVL